MQKPLALKRQGFSWMQQNSIFVTFKITFYCELQRALVLLIFANINTYVVEQYCFSTRLVVYRECKGGQALTQVLSQTAPDAPHN